MRRPTFFPLLLVTPLITFGCYSSTGPDGPTPPKTSKVSGVIMIDGAPAPPGLIELKLYPKGREPKRSERIPKCLVRKEGEFAFSSYRDGDGAEPGDYVLSMEKLKMGGPGELYGPDQFGNNFNSPLNEDPRFQVKVVDGEPTEIPVILIETDELEPQKRHRYASPPGKRL